MTFARVWPVGIADSAPALGAKLTQLDLNVSRSLDGAAGGDVAPTVAIGIGGAGLKSKGLFGLAASKFPAGALNWVETKLVAGKTVGASAACAMSAAGIIATVPDGGDALYLSTDDGNSWLNIASRITTAQGITVSSCACTYQEGILDSSIVIVGSNVSAKYYTSTDSAATFTNRSNASGTPTGHSVFFRDSVHSQFIAGGRTAGAPYLANSTDNGVTWTTRTVPASITGSNLCSSIAQSPGGRLVAAFLGSQTKVAWSDDGITWNASTTSLTAGIYTVTFGDGIWIAADASGHIYQSTDGDTWTTAGMGTVEGTFSKGMCCLNGLFVFAEDLYLTYSADKGATFQQVLKNPNPARVTRNVVAMAGRIWLFASDGSDSYLSRSFRVGLGSLSL